MNKKIIPIVIILLLLVIGVAAILMMTKKSTPQDSTNTIPKEAQNGEGSKGQTIEGTLKSLLTGGKSQKCTFGNSTEKTTVNGTFYISKGKMRGDFKSTSGEIDMNTHMIVDSSFSYMWTDKTNQGFKFPIEEQEKTAPSQDNQPVDLNEKMNYTCSDWREDSSLFSLPANITFQSFVIPTLAPTGSAGGSVDKCSVCNSLPAGDAQDACKTQLNCQ